MPHFNIKKKERKSLVILKEYFYIYGSLAKARARSTQMFILSNCYEDILK